MKQPPKQHEITQLLAEWSDGNQSALDELYPLVYDKLHRHDIAEMLDTAAREAEFTPLDRARYRRDKAFVARLCGQAVNRLFEASGARGVMDSEPIQRFHRDAHGASHHAALTWDPVAEQYGRAALGLPVA